jgi:hypothetical protein
MFLWYRDAELCIAYLHDVSKYSQGTNSDDPAGKRNTFFKKDLHEPAKWCEREWTLQELLAPRELEFYDADW